MIKFNISIHKYKKVLLVFSSFIKVFSQEIGMAFLPILTFKFICLLMDESFSDLTLYNNLYIGFVTLSMGNIFYLFYEYEKKDKTIKHFLMISSIGVLLFSLIAFVITSLEALDIYSIQINEYYHSFSMICICFIFLTELLKISDDYRRKTV